MRSPAAAVGRVSPSLRATSATRPNAGYNGGRWRVHGLLFTDYAAAVAAFDTNDSGDFDSDEEVATALHARAATDIGVVKSFVCPVIKLPRS